MKTPSCCLLLALVGCGLSLDAQRDGGAGCPEPAGPALPDSGTQGAHWVAVGAPTTGAHRYDQSATLLADGRVLAAGGEEWNLSGAGGGAVRAGAELYDPSTRGWAPTGSLNIARGAHRATLLDDGRVLVTGGEAVPMSEWTALASAELFDPTTRTWRLTAPMTSARVNHAQARLADGRVIVAGGTRAGAEPFDAPETLAGVEVFDPVSETWATWAPLMQPEPFVDALLLGDGRVLFTGLFHTELYDPSVGSQPAPPAPPPYSPPTPYAPQEGVECGAPGFLHATALHSGSAHILSAQMSYLVAPTRPVSCRSLLGPTGALTGALASVTLPNGRLLLTFATQDAALLDPETGAVVPLPQRIFPRGTSHLLLLHDGSALVTGGDDVPSEVLEWQ